MPELPEVQTLINTLSEEDIFNKKIADIEVYLPKLLKNSTPKKFKEALIGEKIKSITRVGKYLIFHITHDKVLAVHLRMEGKLFFQTDGNYPMDKKHLLVKFKIGKGELLYYDTRRFGTFHLFNEDNYLDSKELSKIAIDPLDKSFDWKFLKQELSKSNKHIKTALLDQSKVSGIGNIYADEILFASKINPLKPANKITDEEFKLIAKHATRILNLAVENKGTTIFTYLYKNNEQGQFQKFLKVHLKKGKPCPNCKTIIQKTKVNGRGTYYCPHCQKQC